MRLPEISIRISSEHAAKALANTPATLPQPRNHQLPTCQKGIFVGLDLGTTNTVLTLLHQDRVAPVFLELNGITRTHYFGGYEVNPLSEEYDSKVKLLTPPSIPTAVREHPSTKRWWSRFIPNKTHMPRALIGEAALADYQSGRIGSVKGFKSELAKDALQLVGIGGKLTAIESAELYLSELIRLAQNEHKFRIREITVTTPVERYDGYRAVIKQILNKLGVKKVNFVDEPVAAAIGYGLSFGTQRFKNTMVVDIGGGTLDISLVELSTAVADSGSCKVIAKTGRKIGGDDIDRWLLADYAERTEATDILKLLEHEQNARLNPGQRMSDQDAWNLGLLLDQARETKERLLFELSSSMERTDSNPEGLWAARLRNTPTSINYSRQMLEEILEKRGFYARLRASLTEVLNSAEMNGVNKSEVGKVLLVGGSSLLPNVREILEEFFPSEAIAEHSPFHAVSQGAAVFAAGRIPIHDILAHDYALRVFDSSKHTGTYQTLFAAGTRIPTAPHSIDVVPLCLNGEPESIYKLLILELAKVANVGEQQLVRGEDGTLRILNHGDEVAERSLNSANPTIGHLNPPHQPGDKTPRLTLTFQVDADGWLLATAKDLKSGTTVMDRQQVVRVG